MNCKRTLEKPNGRRIRYVLKEKLKLIKEKIKDWHKTHTHNMEGNIKEAKEELSRIEIKGESINLSEKYMNRKRETTSKFYKLSDFNYSIPWQRAISKWLKE